MKRLTKDQINLIQKLCKSNLSLNKISKALSLSKGTTYYWYRKIKGKSILDVNINTDSNEKIGEMMGIFAGDGNYTLDNSYRYQVSIYINAKDREYVKHVEELTNYICNKKPFIYTIESSNVTILRMLSKKFFLFIWSYLKWSRTKTKTVGLRKDANSFDNDFSTGFLRGLMDTDGYINKKDHLATYNTISKKLADNIEQLLTMLGIYYKKYVYKDPRGNRNPIFRIRISKDFEKFIRIIKPKHFNYFNTDTYPN